MNQIIQKAAWQFFQDGQWHTGMETNNHRRCTADAGYPIRDLMPVEQCLSMLADKEAEIKRLTRINENLLQQARIWKLEARTQQSTVASIGALVGCDKDYEMVSAVKTALEQYKRDAERMQYLLCRARAFVDAWDDDSQEFMDLCGDIDNALNQQQAYLIEDNPAISEFERGVMYAAAQIIRLHDEPQVAADVLKQAGLDQINCSALDDYDKESLREVNAVSGIGLTGLDTQSEVKL